MAKRVETQAPETHQRSGGLVGSLSAWLQAAGKAACTLSMK